MFRYLSNPEKFFSSRDLPTYHVYCSVPRRLYVTFALPSSFHSRSFSPLRARPAFQPFFPSYASLGIHFLSSSRLQLLVKTTSSVHGFGFEQTHHLLVLRGWVCKKPPTEPVSNAGSKKTLFPLRALLLNKACPHFFPPFTRAHSVSAFISLLSTTPATSLIGLVSKQPN